MNQSRVIMQLYEKCQLVLVRTSRPLLMIMVLVVVFVPFASGQGDVSDQELIEASHGKIIRVGIGGPGSGKTEDVPLEVYVARVLAGESAPRAAPAAQQALAIAIRTYVLVNQNRHQRDGFNICDTTHCQVMRVATTASRHAALVTSGQLLLHKDGLADVFYYASCGGQSEAVTEVWPGTGSRPYLRSVEDDVCKHDKPWVVELTTSELRQALLKAGFAGSRLSSLDITRRSTSGRVAQLRLVGLRPDVIAGDNFRSVVGYTVIPSTAFTIQRTRQGYRFTGRGAGHGVGMCVIGAGRRAARGESTGQILGRYYPGLRISTLDIDQTSNANLRIAKNFENREAAVLSNISAWVPTDVGIDEAALIEIAAQAQEEIGRALGVATGPLVIELHDSIDSFRQKTGHPWWMVSAVTGARIDLAPLAVLEQRNGLVAALRAGVARSLMGQTFTGRPVWTQVGGAHYFARVPATPLQPVSSRRLECPSDAELTMAVSAVVQREAEMRAEACFSRAFEQAGDWRRVQ